MTEQILCCVVFKNKKTAIKAIFYFYGRNDWTDVALLRRFVVARQSLTGILPSASPPCQTAFSLVRVDHFVVFKNKKNRHKGDFLIFNGRNDWTRTSDLFVPNEAFYQAELHSV